MLAPEQADKVLESATKEQEEFGQELEERGYRSEDTSPWTPGGTGQAHDGLILGNWPARNIPYYPPFSF